MATVTQLEWIEKQLIGSDLNSQEDVDSSWSFYVDTFDDCLMLGKYDGTRCTYYYISEGLITLPTTRYTNYLEDKVVIKYICTVGEYLDYCQQREALSAKERPIPDNTTSLESLQTLARTANIDIEIHADGYNVFDYDTERTKEFTSAEEVLAMIEAKIKWLAIAGEGWE